MPNDKQNKDEMSEESEDETLEDETAAEESTEEPDGEDVQAELKRTRAALKAANAEAAKRRKELKRFEEDEQKRKDAELSESERLQKELAAAQAAQADAEARVNDVLLRSEVERAAVKAGFVDPEVAYQLADLSEVEIDEEDGSVSGADKAVKALAKEKPYLLRQPDKPDIDAGTRGGSDGKGQDVEAIKRRFGI